MNAIIKVENLGKKYIIDHQSQERYTALRDVIAVKFKNINNRFKSLFDNSEKELNNQIHEQFWALKDISFEVNQGERIGIIGRNGAGKSTLLKVLSRITSPTTGKIKIKGRVASLLEVGTGFHPELTGRENIFLNGAILGMAKTEIKKKFDEIVSFAEVEKFLDTPVKRYSSGMYVRLAFAVAAHLDPEILVVDEVLAVGDLQFQKKCLGKMEEVSLKEGRTILFVSHNMAAIEHLCDKCILLNKGQIVMYDSTLKVRNHYINNLIIKNIELTPLAERTDRTGNGVIRLTDFYIEDDNNNKILEIHSGMNIEFVFSYKCVNPKLANNVDMGFSIYNNDQLMLSVLYSSFTGKYFDNIGNDGEFRVKIEKFPFAKGTYIIGSRVIVNGIEADWPREGIAKVYVDNGNFYETGSSGFQGNAPFLVTGKWENRIIRG